MRLLMRLLMRFKLAPSARAVFECSRDGCTTSVPALPSGAGVSPAGTAEIAAETAAPLPTGSPSGAGVPPAKTAAETAAPLPMCFPSGAGVLPAWDRLRDTPDCHICAPLRLRSFFHAFNIAPHAVFDVVIDNEVQLLVRESVVRRQYGVNFV